MADLRRYRFSDQGPCSIAAAIVDKVNIALVRDDPFARHSESSHSGSWSGSRASFASGLRPERVGGPEFTRPSRRGRRPSAWGSAGEATTRGRQEARRASLTGGPLPPFRPRNRTILGSITKRGNRYLRMLFMQGARAALLHPANWPKHSFGLWLTAASRRLHRNVQTVALANKLARIALTILVQGRNYDTRILPTAA